MVISAAKTVAAYLAELPKERRAEVSAVRDILRAHLPAGFVEEIGYGMISYHVPLKRYPDTYNKQPLMYAALAAQKNFYALYLMSSRMDKSAAARLEKAFKAKGSKLDMGKSCIRFQKASDLPLKEVGEIVSAMTVDEWIARYEDSRRATPKQAVKKTAKKTAKKAATKATKKVAKKTTTRKTR